MTTIATIQTALVDWCTLQLPNRIVLQSSGGQGAQPNTEYCVILLKEQSKLGYQSAKLSVNGDEELISNTCHAEVIIDFYYGEAKQDAAILRASLASSERFIDLWEVCGLVDDGIIDDLTALETGAMRQRARFTFNISLNLGWSFSSDSFNQTTIDVRRQDLNDVVAEIAVDGSQV